MPIDSQYVTCPLDKYHVIQKHKLQTHLVKCERNHDMSKKSKCPYNRTHIVDTIEFQHHVETCPDAKSVQEYFYDTDQRPLKGILTMQEVIARQANMTFDEESWDVPRNGQSGYDPTKFIESKNVLRSLSVGTKSEKKAFRESERQRHANLSNNHAVPASQRYIPGLNHNNRSSPVGGSSSHLSESKFRQPKTDSKTMSLENLSIGAFKKQLSKQSLKSASCVVLEETPCEVQQLENKKTDDSQLENVAKNMEKMKLTDDTTGKEKYDAHFPQLGQSLGNLGSGDDNTKKLPAIGRGSSFKNLLKTPGEASKSVVPRWSSAKTINKV